MHCQCRGLNLKILLEVIWNVAIRFENPLQNIKLDPRQNEKLDLDPRKKINWMSNNESATGLVNDYLPYLKVIEK
jgi:DNA primase